MMEMLLFVGLLVKHYDTEFDVSIDNWEKSGLKLPSVIRVHKIATLEKNMIEVAMGHIEAKVIDEVKKIFINLPK